MIKRRFLAYIYDVCILVLILLLTSYFLPVSEKKKNLSEEKNSDDSSDELYNQTFSAHIIKLDLENNLN